MCEPLKQGWSRPAGATAFHCYGEDRRSLCGRYRFFPLINSPLRPIETVPLPACKACVEKLGKR